MPREESIAETGKQRSLRVPLDHYRQPNRLVEMKWWLTAIGAIAAGLYFAWLMLPTSAARQQVSPGPLAAAHATWNGDCATCHQNLQPLRSDALSVVGLFRGQTDHRQTLDQACIKCHNTPVHHASAKADDIPSCASCHRDHQGPGADIVRASDAACLSCHRKLESHRNGPSGLNPQLANITCFAPTLARSASEGNQLGADLEANHPDFRSLKDDPGNIKFNHWLHLQPGIAPVESKKKLLASDVPAAFQKRYAGYAKPDGLVQLDCAACHEPERDGAYMRPIAFEQHCKACHPLAWKFAEDQPIAEVPHGLTSERLAAVLDGLAFAAEAKRSDSKAVVADETADLPLIPGKTLGRNLAQKIGQDLLGHRNAAARAITTKCQECHIVAESRTNASDNLPDFVSGDLPEFLPAQIPVVWLRHARFDHSAHRYVQCLTCHAAAFAYEEHDKPQYISSQDPFAKARDDEQVMIAGIGNCATCHAPTRGKVGGARFDCAECHNYHGGDTTFFPSFTGSSLGTHYHEAPASSAHPNTPNIRLASFQTPPAEFPHYTGTSSCTSTGCHGGTHSTANTWQTAFTTWASRDPHAQACEVLWTFRGREMTRLLEAKVATLSDAEHSEAIQRRCLGCHATPPPNDSAASQTQSASGVQCESCHGAAGNWLHSHYQTGFRRNASGFVDSKDLNQRAKTCLKCHVGPSDAADSPQAVDHDLIAAGHPRLSFEFRTYLQSLPAHWDRQKDESRLGDSFHFQSWHAGQNELSTWRKNNSGNPLTDFAQLDCSSCHHTLAADPARLQAGLRLLPPPSPNLPIPANRSLSPLQRLAFARELLANNAAQHQWDGALQTYLAVRAIAADQPINKMTDWNSTLARLGSYLAQDCFPAELRDKRPPSPYDSPSQFDPTRWQQEIKPVVEMLKQLETTASQP